MLDGVNQVQVHPKAGLTFATCLPSILRQDPDVIWWVKFEMAKLRKSP